MSDHPLFVLASTWETVESDARKALKEFITGLVGYPCQLACQPNNGSVDIYVQSIKKNRITDWIEIQPDGAVGVIFDSYEDKDPTSLSDRCEDYNASISVVYESESESESDGEDDCDSSETASLEEVGE